MVCPLGFTWPSVCAAMRAGITRKSTSRYVDDQGREIVASFMPDSLPPDAQGERRWIALLAHVLRDVANARGLRDLASTPVFLGIPASSTRPPPSGVLASALADHLQTTVAGDQLYLFPEGACAGHVALQQGASSVASGRECIVAAADSLSSGRRLLALAAQDRLLVEGNSDGLIPGEAAAAVFLTATPARALARLRGFGFAQEPSRLDNDAPFRAEGLVRASRAALRAAGLEMHEVDFRVSDASGESYRFKEQALLVARILRQPKAELPVWLPAATLGDTGAAAGLCGMLWAMAGWARNYAPGPRVLACASSDDGARAAAVLEQVRGG
jgi:3-oxoacyl-[acyl-carrier-protein] synthase-1